MLARHSSEQIAKAQLAQGVAGGVAVAAGEYDAGRAAMVVSQMIQMKYGRDDEIQSDTLGVKYMAQAGYDPRSGITLWKKMLAASKGGRGPEFLSTHPAEETRIKQIEKLLPTVMPLYEAAKR